MIKKLLAYSSLNLFVLLAFPALALAHVIVTPSTAGIGQELVFNVSCPNEQQTPIIKLTLDIPKGVSEVVPTEKDGWAISITNSGGSDPQITSITWSGGQVPVSERTDFGFGAQVPGSATQLDWKAYQTYANGTIVHWDQTPTGSDDATGNAGPYSVTKVTNDLTASTTTTTTSKSVYGAYILGGLAFIMSLLALSRRKSS